MLKLGKARYQARARWLHVPDLFFVEEKKGKRTLPFSLVKRQSEKLKQNSIFLFECHRLFTYNLLKPYCEAG
jgi:hypothetical protein